MAFDDLWTHSYCLACDKQVSTDGAAYCSETCRLSDFEKTSTPSSAASSPGLPTTSTYPWSARPSTPTKFYLSPAYDFTNAQPYGATPSRQQPARLSRAYSTASTTSPRGLTPSSSHSSLCSMQSSASNADAQQVSDKARQELRAYDLSFEHIRMHRRRSY